MQCSNTITCDICDAQYLINNNNICELQTTICGIGQVELENSCVMNCPNGTYLTGNKCGLRCRKQFYYNARNNFCYTICPNQSTAIGYACEFGVWLLIKIIKKLNKI